MWSVLPVTLTAAILTIFQISFLSHLASPLSDISLPLVVISYSVVTDRPIIGAIWALIGGILLDLHGLYEFGTQLSLLFVVLMITMVAFQRVFTNVSLLSVFLLTALGAVIHMFGAMVIDGIRVLFGGVPYILSFESAFLASTLRTALINGVIVVMMMLVGTYIKRSFRHIFIFHEKR